MQRWLVGVLSILGTLGGAIEARALEPKCPYLLAQDPSFPGLRLDSNLRDLRDQVSNASGCFDRGRRNCVFVDRFGYENQFSEFLSPEISGDGVSDRFLFRREAHRRRGGWLPFGVLWSDSPSVIERKLTALGVASMRFRHAHTRGVSAIGCFTKSHFRVEFEFGDDDRLNTVVQAQEWP